MAPSALQELGSHQGLKACHLLHADLHGYSKATCFPRCCLERSQLLKTGIGPLRGAHVLCNGCSCRPRLLPPSFKVLAAAAGAAGDASSSAAVGEEVKGDMLSASIFNNNLFRLAATAATVALTAKTSAYLPAQGLAFVHLLAYGTWLGSTIWTTFIAGARHGRAVRWCGSVWPAHDIPAG